MTQVPETIRDFLKQFSGIGDFRFFTGFSGGADSTALVLAMQEAGLAFTAVHFQHGIRGSESIADAEWCERFCKERRIPFKRIDLDVPSNALNGEGTEEAARRLRLEAWGDLAGENSPVFLAHHRDDALENLMLRLARGGNSSGLTGLRSIRRLGKLTLCRPFLQLHKDDLIEYLKSRGIADWREDATNGDSAYRRNAVRNELLPLWRRIFCNDGGILRSLEALQDDADFLETQAQQAVAELRCLDDWRNLPSAIFGRVLRIWLNDGDGDIPPSRATICRIKRELENFTGKSKTITLEDGIVLTISKDGLKKVNGEVPTVEWREVRIQDGLKIPMPEIGKMLVVSSDGDGEKFDADALLGGSGRIIIRSWQAGDRIRPFGATYQRKLQDVFTDAKISGDARKSFPVILKDDEIIWVAGLKRGEFGRITPKTGKILCLSLQDLKK